MARSTPSGIFRLASLFVFFLYAATGLSSAQNSKFNAVKASPFRSFSPANGKLAAQTAGLPLMFEKNIGQPGAIGDFTARGNGYTLDLNSGKMSLRVTGQHGQSDSLQISFVGADRKASGTALHRLPALTNYFIGRDRAKWRTGVDN